MDAPVPVQARWMLDPSLGPSYVNALLLQPGAPTSDDESDGVYITFGHVNPPAFDSPEDAEKFAVSGVLPITPVTRLFVTRQRLADWNLQINQFLEGGEQK